MKPIDWKLSAALATLLILASTASSSAEQPRLLWQVGQPDNNTAEFALGPGNYAQYDQDGLFLVGMSKPKQDWPYVQPGPDDVWADSRRHTFTVFFGLEGLSPRDEARLVVDLVDTHSINPPPLRIEVNGHAYERKLPPGAGDASIFGAPQRGREHRFSVPLAETVLREGLNEIKITTLSGGWILYDWLGLEVSPTSKLQSCPATGVSSLRVDPWLSDQDGELVQQIDVELVHAGTPTDVTMEATGLKPKSLTVKPGMNKLELQLPPVQEETPLLVEIKQHGQTLDSRQTIRRKVKERELVDWVDCLLGTATSRWMLYPGPSMPFGMVKLSPDNQRHCWKAGYEYTIENIAGFSHIHSWTMGGLLTMPTVGELKVVPGAENDPDAGYRSRFSHDTETASPGYYAVTLADYGIRAELTSTTRAGMQRYTFPKSDQARILFDLLDADRVQLRRPGGQGHQGQRHTRSRATASSGAAPGRSGTTTRSTSSPAPTSRSSRWAAGSATRSARTSPRSPARRRGRVSELLTTDDGEKDPAPDRHLAGQHRPGPAEPRHRDEALRLGLRRRAPTTPARSGTTCLGRIEIEGGTATDRQKFYTNMYRSYCARTIWSDVNGKYVDMYEKVQQLADPDSPVYGCDAFWNTFWNLNQLWTLATPDVANKWVKSLLEINDKGGWLPKGPTGIEYSSIMVASHEIALIVGAYQKGIRNFDVAEGLRGDEAHPDGAGPAPRRRRSAWATMQLAPYMKLGYVPVEKGPVSNTLEYAYDDWCVAQMAKALGKTDDYEYFLKRSMNYKNVFDPSVGYVAAKAPRTARWVKDFSPFSRPRLRRRQLRGNTPGSSPHDVGGTGQAAGQGGIQPPAEQGLGRLGRQPLQRHRRPHGRIPNQPRQPAQHAGGLAVQLLRHALADPEVEPADPRPSTTASGPIDGYPGDEDQGQMGAWYVMAAMGLFEMDGGCATKPIYEIGSPLFERVTIHLDPNYYPGGQLRDRDPQQLEGELLRPVGHVPTGSRSRNRGSTTPIWSRWHAHPGNGPRAEQAVGKSPGGRAAARLTTPISTSRGAGRYACQFISLSAPFPPRVVLDGIRRAGGTSHTLITTSTGRS